MSGVVEHRLIPAGDLRLEGSQCFLQLLESHIRAQRHGKPDVLQRSRHCLGICACIVQRRDRLVTVVADDERNPLGLGARAGEQRTQRENQRRQRPPSSLSRTPSH